MLFCTTNFTVNPVTLERYVINEEENTKFLGASLDNNLNWKYHVNTLMNKVCSARYIFTNYRERDFLAQKLLG